ncbi:MAG: glycosyltransferase family 9 protein [Rhodospirillaceae bacterium]
MSANSPQSAETTGSHRPELGRCLVFTGGGLGDTLFHLAHYRAIAARSSGGKIHLAVKKGRMIRTLFAHLPEIEAVHGAARDESRSGKISLWEMRRLFASLKLDTVIALHPSGTIPMAARLAGVRRVYGFRERATFADALYTQRALVSPDRPVPPLMTGADALFRDLSWPFDHDSVRFLPAAEDAATADGLLQGVPEPWVCIGLNGSTAEKRWAKENFRLVIGALAKRGVGAFILFGGPDVAEDAAWLKAASYSDLCPSPPVFVDADGRHGLGVDHALLARCCLYVGNDSFGLNLAVFCGLPAAVGLFGPTAPLTYSPRLIAVEADPPGSGMGSVPVEKMQTCLEALKLPGLDQP